MKSLVFDGGVVDPSDGTRRSILPRNPSAMVSRLEALFLIGIVCSASVAADAQTEVTFPDAALNAAVHNRLQIPLSEPIMDTDFLGGRFTLFSVTDSRISRLDGLEFASELTFLSITSASLTSIVPLGGLTALTSLSLRFCGLTDIGPLRNLTNLRALFLQGNRIVSLDGLPTTEAYNVINLDDNAISDLRPLAGLRIEELFLSNNSIGDLTGLSGMMGLQKLWLDGNSIVDLSPIADAITIRQLFLRFNFIEDITPLAGYDTLYRLDLSVNFISSLDGLPVFCNNPGAIFKQLEINEYGDEHGCAAIRNERNGKTFLDLGFNLITDISPLLENAGIGGAVGPYEAEDSVRLVCNPLSAEARFVQVPQLRSKGVFVETLSLCLDRNIIGCFVAGTHRQSGDSQNLLWGDLAVLAVMAALLLAARRVRTH